MFRILTLLLLLSVCCACGETEQPASDTTTTDSPTETAPLVEQPTTEETAIPIYTFDHEERLSTSSLADKSLHELDVMRNEIYAHHGYQFKNAEWKAHFAEAGFAATQRNVEDRLTTIDLANLEAIRLQKESLLATKQTLSTPQGIDITLGDQVDVELQQFISRFMAAAHEQDKALLQQFIHPAYEDFVSADQLINAFAEKEPVVEDEILTYTLDKCSSEYCDWCNSEIDVTQSPTKFTLTKYWEYQGDDEDIARGESMVQYMFTAKDGNYVIYCMAAAG